jgi:hypothetical protein
MRANADNPWPASASLANLRGFEKQVNATMGPIAISIESGQCSRSTKALLEPIKMSIKAH